MAFSTWIRTTNSGHRAIFSGMAWISLFILLGKLLGAAKEMVVATRFGAGIEIDAYLFVVNFISWPLGLWFSVLTVALVPAAARMRQASASELPRFRAELLGAAIIIGLSLTALLWAGLFFFIGSSWSGLPPATSSIAYQMLGPLMILVPAGIVASLFSSWMLAAGRHANTLMEGLAPLVIAIAILIAPGFGMAALVWGTVAGAVLYMGALGFMLFRTGELERPSFAFGAGEWSSFRQGFGIMLIGNALMSLIVIVDLLFTVRLGAGAVATLGYANRVLALGLALGGTAITRATLPVFSSIEGKGRNQVYLLASQWAHLMLAGGAIGMIVLWWLAPDLIRLLFERGAFTADDTLAVATLLRYGAIQLPFYFSCLVLVSYLATGGAHKLLSIGAGINLVIKIAGNFVLVPIFGIEGVVLSTGLMYLVSFAMLYRMASMLNRRQSMQERPLG